MVQIEGGPIFIVPRADRIARNPHTCMANHGRTQPKSDAHVRLGKIETLSKEGPYSVDETARSYLGHEPRNTAQ